MARKAGLYTFLRGRVDFGKLEKIPEAAKYYTADANRQGFKTTEEHVAQFMYLERKRLKEGRPLRKPGERHHPTKEGVEKRLEQGAPPVFTVNGTISNMDQAMRAIDAIIGMLSLVKRQLVIESKFRTKVNETILPALKEAGLIS